MLVACLGQRACTCDELLLSLRKQLPVIGIGSVTSLGAGAGWTNQRMLSLLSHSEVITCSYDLSLPMLYLFYCKVCTLTIWMFS